ncbi:hypothetical protein [Larsenimonas salina]|uniref:hypothetical protein n=1 Tax=Larsenimonas salina TaxID=1295565 RepID=UPI0020730DAB|nr:hypothetical protein [Larsenimonas salina]MCM5703514.1 hypothetical protein [Larsenimonas salina]
MITEPYYTEQFTPCQSWLSNWLDQFEHTPQHAWHQFESAHRTAFIILRATHPDMPDDYLIDSLIQAQMQAMT